VRRYNVVKRLNEAKAVQETNSRSLAQVAWNFANDSLRTTLCLQFEAQDIAHATLYLGGAVQVDSIKTRVESAPGFSA